MCVVGFQSLRGKLCCVYPTGLGWYSLGSNIAHSIWWLCLRLRSKLFVICVWCLLFHNPTLQNIKHKRLDLTSITSNVVAGLRNDHVHVFTRPLQSTATNTSPGPTMHFKKQTLFLLQEIITLWAQKYTLSTQHMCFHIGGRVVWHSYNGIAQGKIIIIFGGIFAFPMASTRRQPSFPYKSSGCLQELYS